MTWLSVSVAKGGFSVITLTKEDCYVWEDLMECIFNTRFADVFIISISTYLYYER